LRRDERPFPPHLGAPGRPRPGFTKQYGLKRLVWYERFEDIRDAVQREKTMKHWPRAWKVRLIHGMNPDWDDLYEMLNQ
jgi:putative endonuclease